MFLFEKIKSMFKKLSFVGSATLADGKQLRISGGEMVEGAQVFLETKEGEIPLPDGVWELQENYTIVTQDAKIVSVQENVEVNEPEPLVEMSEEVPVQTVEDVAQVTITEEEVIEMETTPESVVEAVAPEPDRIGLIETKLDNLLSKLEQMVTSFNEVTQKVEENKADVEMRFEKLSSTPSLKKMDKEVPFRPGNTILGSYEELLKQSK
jgi:hypothetical protein